MRQPKLASVTVHWTESRHFTGENEEMTGLRFRSLLCSIMVDEQRNGPGPYGWDRRGYCKVKATLRWDDGHTANMVRFDVTGDWRSTEINGYLPRRAVTP